MTLDKFIVWSDHHIHKFPYGSAIVDTDEYGPCNSRLLDSVQCLEQMSDYAVANGIDTFVFTGDLFHKRTVLDVQTYQMAHEYLDRISGRIDNSTIFLMPGNHDYADRHGVTHSLSSLSADLPNGSKRVVMNEATYLPLSTDMNTVGYFVPYSDDRAVLKAAFDKHAAVRDGLMSDAKDSFLFFHCGIQGAKVGSDYVMQHDSDCSLGDLHTEKYDLAIGGHYHEHQYLNANTLYVGAMLQHNWGDVGSKRGFLVVERGPNGWATKQIETKAPKFESVEASKLLKGQKFDRNTFVRVQLDEGITAEEVTSAKEGAFASLEVVATPAADVSGASLSIDSARFDPMSVLESWVDSQQTKMDRDKLLTYGQKILTSVLSA